MCTTIHKEYIELINFRPVTKIITRLVGSFVAIMIRIVVRTCLIIVNIVGHFHDPQITIVGISPPESILSSGVSGH